MPRLSITGRNGDRILLEGETGRSVMEIIREAGIDNNFGNCDGYCICGTCHIYIDTDLAGSLATISKVEKDLLDSLEYVQAGSRLSCQLRFDASLDGLKVTLAPEE